MQELQQFIDKMRATSSSTDKVQIIKDSNPFIHKILEYTYNPFKQYYVTSKTCEKNNDLVDYMTTEPVIVQVLEGKDAVNNYRRIMGDTNPDKAENGTIRKKFAISIKENSVHGSDSEYNANKEINFFFNDKEIVG